MKTLLMKNSSQTKSAKGITTGTKIIPLKAKLCDQGFTILEMLIVVAIIGILVALAIPAYTEYKNMAKISRAISEVRSIVDQIAFYQSDKINLPGGLSELPKGIAEKDPWGHDYVYYLIPADGSGAYQDLNGDPLNPTSGFDIYSKGADGQTALQLLDDAAHHSSMDDIVLGANGSIVELGERY